MELFIQWVVLLISAFIFYDLLLKTLNALYAKQYLKTIGISVCTFLYGILIQFHLIALMGGR